MSKNAVSKRRERDPEGTRQGLIDTAVRLMLKQGFAATSVDLICKEAGMTKGSFFHHFGSKEAIGKACESQAMIRANLKLARGHVDGLFDK